MTKKTLILGFLLLCANTLSAQLAVKTNLLYDATTTPNAGLEWGLGKKHTMQVFYGINPWTFQSDSKGERKAKHWLLMPEYRWWTCSKFNGLFLGVHAMGGEFNAGNIDIPLPGAFINGANLRTEVRNSRYEGKYLGGGLTIGYQFILSKKWNLETELGVGYNHIWYDQYPCSDCGTKISKGQTNYVGVTKLGLSLLYFF